VAETKTPAGPTTQPPKPADRPAGPGNPGAGAPPAIKHDDHKDKDMDKDSEPFFGTGTPGAKKPEGAKPATPAKDKDKDAGKSSFSGDPLAMPAPKTGPRPPAPEATAFSQAFSEARSGLDSLLGEENKKLMELKQLNLNLDQALAAFEADAKRTRQLMEKNEAVAREAERLVAEGVQLEKQQDDLEAQVNEAREKLAGQIERAQALRDERAELEAQRNEVKDIVAQESEQNADLKSEIAQLKARRDALTEETNALNQAKVRYEEQVGRLQRLREEFLSAITRAKGQQEELMQIPSADDIAPAPAPKPAAPKPAAPKGDAHKGDKSGEKPALADKAEKPGTPAGSGF
jgi:hypothetical protein